ncbi:MAG TPA: hypothetical protein VLR52_01415, partial [Bacteroidales bacterium]|nr:hypothetical protein [Bacteroidales bacterium]
MEKGFLWLMIIALIGSGISVAYYFKPITGIILKEGDGVKMESHRSFRWHIIFLTVITILLGIVPFWITNLL